MSIYGSLINEGFFSDRKKKKEEKKVAKQQEKDQKSIKMAIDDINEVIGKAIWNMDDNIKLSLWLNYYPVSQSQFDSIIKPHIESQKELIWYFNAEEDSDEDVGKDTYEFLKSNGLLNTEWMYFELIDDTFIVYSCKTKKIYYGGECSLKEAKIYDINSFKSALEDFYYNNFKFLVEADKQLGYYKLSSPPSGVTPKPVPPYKK